MGVPYKTAEEFNERMNNTIVWFNDEPVWVVGLHPGGRLKVSYCPLPTGKWTGGMPVVGERLAVAPLSDNGWKAKDLLLGYVNDLHEVGRPVMATYITRMPVRRWKQGLTAENLDIPEGTGHNYWTLMALPAFKDALVGKYPVFQEAKATVMAIDKWGKDKARVAFSRSFALEYGADEILWLLYRGFRVANSPNGEVFRLPEAKSHLREIIENQGLKVA